MKSYVCWSDQSTHTAGSGFNKSHARKWRTLLCRRASLPRRLGHNIYYSKLSSNDNCRMQLAICCRYVMKFSFAPIERKSNSSSHVVIHFIGVLFGVIHTNTLVENLLSVTMSHHSNDLLMSLNAAARVCHLQWTQQTLDQCWICYYYYYYYFGVRCARPGEGEDTLSVQRP